MGFKCKIGLKSLLFLWDGLEADLEAADGGSRGLVLHLSQPRLVAHVLTPAVGLRLAPTRLQISIGKYRTGGSRARPCCLHATRPHPPANRQ